MMSFQEIFNRNLWDIENLKDQSGKVFVITGANSGIGYETTLQLAKVNATIVMACRNMEKAKTAKTAIEQHVKNPNLEIMHIDLGNINVIDEFATRFKANYNRLDVLINNAGIFHVPKLQTDNGFEMHFGVNHLGHFVLTQKLFPRMKETADSRVITVSSVGYKLGKIHFSDINLEEDYTKSKAYTQSKLANMLFGYELQNRLDNSNNTLKSIIVHPGITKSEIYNKAGELNNWSLWTVFYKFVHYIMAQSQHKGSLPILYASTEDEIQGGELIGPNSFFEMRGYPTALDIQDKAKDETIAKELWELSEEMTGIDFTIE